jgi:hypothetical protein
MTTSGFVPLHLRVARPGSEAYAAAGGKFFLPAVLDWLGLRDATTPRDGFTHFS